jgi:alcohol dehydrogenase class IV
MRFNLPVAGHKYAVAARAMGLNGDDEAAASSLIRWMEDIASQMGVVRPPAGYLLLESEYDKIIAETLASGSTKHNPREVTAADVRHLLENL